MSLIVLLLGQIDFSVGYLLEINVESTVLRITVLLEYDSKVVAVVQG